MPDPVSFAELLHRQNMLVLERTGDRMFRPIGLVPAWLGELLPADAAIPERFEAETIFPFLACFLPEAERHWTGEKTGQELRSGLWTENARDQSMLHLDAVACAVGGLKLLLIRRLEAEFEQLHHAYQTGREALQGYERLVNETSKKEILLHCVIHDLSGPLAGIMGAIEILAKEKLSKDGRRFLDHARVAARQQADFINSLLECFRAEMGLLESLENAEGRGPDIIAAARGVLEALKPAFAVRGVTCQIMLAPDSPARLPVAGEKNRLERVFHNLVQNALRYSPPNGKVTVTIQPAGAEVHVCVEDEGPGVPPELAPQLFQKFIRGGKSSGKAGLGLFFCRITVEQWGGSITCEPRAEGGTRFWFRLKAG
jgi:signal transduction histidine kinase